MPVLSMPLGIPTRARGFHCEELTMPGQNHFDIVKGLQRADDPLTRAMLAQMGL